MANTIITPSMVAREGLMLLENNMVFGGLVHRDHTQEFQGAKVGDTVAIRGPANFTAQEFTTTVTTQNITETSVNLQLEKHFDVTVGVTSKEWTLSLDRFSERVVAPAMLAIAEAIDAYVASKYIEVYNVIGTAGDPPDSLADVVAIDKECNQLKFPVRPRVAVVNPTAKADMLANITQFTQADQRGDGGMALRNASMGTFLGIDWYMDQNIKSHTAGTLSDGSIKGANFNGGGSPQTIGATTMNIDETTLTGTVVKGDVFTVAGDTQEYVVTSGPHTAAGNAITGISFAPAAKVAWADDAEIVFQNDHAANLIFHPSAISLAVVPLDLPRGAAQATYMTARGMGIRVVYDYASSNKSDTISFDVLVGAKVQQPALAARILG